MRLGICTHSMGFDNHQIIEPLNQCKKHGIMLLHGWVESLHSSSVIREAKEIVDATGIELMIGYYDTYIENGDQQPVDDFIRFIEEICVPLGINKIPTYSTHHRWRKDPPLAEQLKRMASAFRRLCEAAEPYGVRLAIENHADYRGTDIVKLIEMVEHPAMRAKLDTGNAFPVAEDPVDAAMAMAPYVISTHIKDMTVRPLTDNEWIKVQGCAIGEGDVDYDAIVDILTKHCPEAYDLPFMLEIEPSQKADLNVLTERAISYVMSRFGEHIRKAEAAKL